jgi:hypothetical protein|tara:strand:+ start:3927 stop:5321 length:1395 start_codon:yes stop_codon:yes gene_type:complete
MTISRMGISSLMGYENGGDVFDLQKFLNQQKETQFADSFDKYQDRLAQIQGTTNPITGFDVASKLGAGLLAQQAEKFPSIGRGLGIGFQSLNEEIAKRKADKKKEEQAVAMKAMELALQDEQQGEKFLNDYALKMIDMQNKDIKTVDFDTSMLVDAKNADGTPLINPQTKVGYKAKTTLRANDPQIDDLLTLGATAIDRASTNINLQGAGNELDKKRASKIADAEARWQEEADAANALRDQILIANSLANELGEDGFGAAENLTLGMRNIMAGLGMDGLVDVDKLAAQQALTQTSIGFVMALVGKTKGAISNREMDIFFAASPTLGSTYKGYMRMLGYMDRIAELSERYNAEWQKESLRLSNEGASIGEIYAAFSNFKTEFKSNPENRLIRTPEERKYLEDIADQKTYNTVNSNYLRVQKEAQKADEGDSIAKLKSEIIEEMAQPDTEPERREYLQTLLDQMGG